MDLKAQKLELIEWLIKLKDTSLIDYLNSIKDSESSSKDWWDDLTTNQIDSINRGLNDIEKGRVHSHDTVWD